MKRFFLAIGVAVLLAACGRGVDPAAAVANAQALIAQGKAGEARILLKNSLARTGNLPGARELLAGIALDEGDMQAAGDELAALDEVAANTARAIGLKVRVALATGRSEEALRLLDAAGDAIAQPEQSELRARALRSQGMPADALTLLRAAQQSNPDDSKLAVEIANTLAATGYLAAAAGELDRYLAGEDRPRSDVLRARGELRLRQGKPAEAIADFKAAVEAAPASWPRLSRASTELLTGEALLAGGDVAAAREQIARIEKQWPGLVGSRILEARLALAEGRASEAAEQLAALVDAVPGDTQLRYQLADALVRSGNLARATELLGKLVAEGPASSPARRMLAALWMRQGRPDRVLEVLGGEAEVLDAAGGSDDLLAAARLARTRAGEAITVLTRRLAEKPEDAGLRAELAAAQVANGEPAAALVTLGPPPARGWLPESAAARMSALLAMGNEIEGNRLVDRLLNPESATDAATLLAAADAAQRQRRGAMSSRLLDRAAALDASNVEIQIRRASLAFDARSYDAARRLLNEALQVEPGHLVARLGLARVAEAEGDVGGARASLEEAVRRAPQALEPALALASLELRAERPAAAGKVLDALIAARPDGTAANAAGSLLLDVHRTDEARTRFRQAVEQDSARAAYWMNLGRTQLALSDFSAARESFVRSAQLEPALLPATMAAVRLSIEQKDLATARQLAGASARELPDSASAQLLRGEAALAAGDNETAREAFARSGMLRPSAPAAVGEYRARLKLGTPRPEAPLLGWVARQPEDIAARRVLADHYLVVRDDRGARAQLEVLIRQAPGDVVSLNNLAWLLRESDTARAERYALHARAIAPDNPAVADTLGVIYLAAGKPTEALQVLAQAAAALPNDRAVQYHHALALHRCGRHEAARETLRRALAGGADFTGRAEARRLMEELGI